MREYRDTTVYRVIVIDKDGFKYHIASSPEINPDQYATRMLAYVAMDNLSYAKHACETTMLYVKDRRAIRIDIPTDDSEAGLDYEYIDIRDIRKSYVDVLYREIETMEEPEIIVEKETEDKMEVYEESGVILEWQHVIDSFYKRYPEGDILINKNPNGDYLLVYQTPDWNGISSEGPIERGTGIKSLDIVLKSSMWGLMEIKAQVSKTESPKLYNTIIELIEFFESHIERIMLND